MMWQAALMVGCSLLVVPNARTSLSRTAEIFRGVEDVVPGSQMHVDNIDPLAVAASFDLLAACLRGGLPVAEAVAAVAVTAPSPMADTLRRVADLLALGADPDVAWSEAALDPGTESLARLARRSSRSGTSLSVAMTELADRSRDEAEDASAASAERAGVLISGPLGLCFLPAFLCLGIVPVVIGLATSVLGDGLI
ncbi:type II secretion system F family protein [Rhodococcus sp. ARC_M6]|uniref:type II secretion system F family protein n=1 Tax=Rhodococcus sp. ARC_M6 TaxID=2928852 RepID=UPI001FB337ED|nr:type II secretion system F family protein [Rhodococcus sp. ARC_M6]MCJ0906440.1 type II secretion system F family protein [Rhodococcus sp. ARC_M6]